MFARVYVYLCAPVCVFVFAFVCEPVCENNNSGCVFHVCKCVCVCVAARMCVRITCS